MPIFRKCKTNRDPQYFSIDQFLLLFISNDSSTVSLDPQPTEKDLAAQYEVTFSPNDQDDPLNWSRWRRWYITMAAGLLGVNAYVLASAWSCSSTSVLTASNRTFASSAPSGIIPEMMQQFEFGHEVAALTIAVFVAGYCVGPLVWGPLSEYYGRKMPLLVTFVVYTGFSVGCALAPNTGAIIVFRFLSGMFAASALVISG